MSHKTKKIGNSQIELTITVTPEAYEPHLHKAAKTLSVKTAIKGFRKGHAPYDIMKKELGEMRILQEAMQSIIQETYVEAVMAEKLEIVGNPEINVEKVAPGNDLEYKAVVALLPEVKLADPKKIKVKAEAVSVEESEVQETLDALRGMHAEEVEKKGGAEGTDIIVIDMNMKVDGVPMEGGQAKDHAVSLGEKHYIPGLTDHLKGMKAGEEKNFTVPFPKDHYQKQFAGKDVEFDVKATVVKERKLPEFTEEFVKKLGQESIETFKKLVTDNMKMEKIKKEEQRQEIAILNAMIEKSTFNELPEVLINAEKQKIFNELKRDLEKHGITVDQYLQDLKKTEKELQEGFAKQAEERAKAALISRQIAKQHALAPTQEEVEAEIEGMKEAYAHNKEAQENLKRQDVHDAIATMVQNRKVIGWLKEQVMGTPKKDTK
ncbi:MAG: trigger factor [Candidatus Magasanikbacteria bacterium]|nr:trigger factor [Candidatus Magasanikbacteria bacterium]